ncbi:hypothetical protein H1C71_037176, partial [Ictidomys tridecemlineatus]
EKIQVQEKVFQASETEEGSLEQKKPSGEKLQQETANNIFLSQSESVQPTAPPLPEGISVQSTAPPPYARRPPTPAVDSWDPETESQVCPVFEVGGQRIH